MAAITMKMPTTASNSIIEKPELVVCLLFFISSTFPHNTDELRPAVHATVQSIGRVQAGCDVRGAVIPLPDYLCALAGRVSTRWCSADKMPKVTLASS
jgi:hypothetical protein